MRQISVAVFLLISGVMLFSGCNKGKVKPDGFPAVVPYKVTVVQGGAPVADANIRFIPSKTEQWTVGGSTDATGTLIPNTILFGFSEPGVPAGEYKVTVSKYDTSATVPAASMEELRKQKPVAPKQLCPAKFTSVSTTPLTTKVEAGGNLQIDLDKK